MTTEEKFNAAVNVIRSLPKNGSYQPSNELMLRFYALFKQATQGPCKSSRPPFWDIVGRVKYDSYKALGNMSKQDAMKNYVDELHRIVETMSYSDKVANFLEAPPSELDSVNMADVDLIFGDVMERVRSASNSPLASREASPNRLQSSLGTTPSDIPTSPEDTDHSDEEYIDTVEIPEPRKPLANGIIHSEPMTNGIPVYKEHKSRAKSKPPAHSNIDISKEITQTVENLKRDMERLTNKVNLIENATKTASKLEIRRKNGFLGGVSPQLLAFIIVWPFLVTFIMRRFLYRKQI
ncbi:hypothetical protein ILUMI_20790 [Ignelater luminosus]|uniref:ACB domain-containing protein n=1 Tax=Ignelater luminosus TaxID=2038154 RepID=A0A8K0CHL4_IGNLU|nr:hypothetical protein ILUMI_20790 [Ignelater luminosus]